MKKIIIILSLYILSDVTSVSGQCGVNILTNPGFDAPIQPNGGDNILNSFSFNGWTMTGGQGFNIVRPNGSYGPGPDNAEDGIQFAEVAYGDGTVYQDFTILGANTNIIFGGFYSSRTGASWSTSISIYSMPGNTLISTSNILQYSNQGNKVWLPVQGNTTLNAGNYRFVASIPDDANFDAAFVFANCSLPTAPVQKPGSGTALAFNGTTDYVDLGDAFNDQNFTVDMWLKPGVSQVQWANIIDNNQTGTDNWLIQQYGYNSNPNEYYYYVSGITSNGTFTLQPNTWQHLAFVKSTTALSVYVNGMLVETTPWGGTVVYNSNRLNLGRLGAAAIRYWKGSMDEVRIWNTALSQSEIRDRMCHKIILSDPLYSNLKAYYNFDEGFGYNLFDSKNSITGAINGPDWVTSGAPIGNFSAHDYSGGSSTATLMHPGRGDAFTATLTAGAADGIHVYNVTETPNTTNGVIGVGSNNAYFGTFVVNGTSPTYDAVYNYANAFPAVNETDLHLYKRADNAATAWFYCNTVPDINANTLTTTGEHTEYMIGSQATTITQKPGSGTALSFNGTSDYVDLGTAFSDQNFTVEMWLKPGATQTGYNDIIDNNPNAVPGAGWVIQQNALNTNEYFGYVSGTTTANFTLIPNVWQHLVLVKGPTAILIYVNGILINSTTWSGTVFYSSNFLRLGTFGGTRSGSLYHWNGSMDEVRIWNTPLSQSEIRDRMCHKIISSDPLYSNLKAYYNFDEGIGNDLFDSKNSITGAINGSTTWQKSAAPIGNLSVNDYSGGSSSATITHPSRGDAIRATLTSGTADGIHVYNVTEAPNTSSGVIGVGNNNAYFGVFVVNGSNPAYDAVYNYANAFPGNNENDLHLFKRDDNAATNWTDCNAARDINANTLTITGQHTEYMIGSIGNALPISGLLFNAVKENTKVKLDWYTLTEINSSHFEIERSKNGIQFEKIAEVLASGNSSVKKDYSYTDATPEKNLNYYRLKQVDTDGRFIYSTLRLVRFGDDKKFMVYPAIASSSITISGITENVLIKLFNSGGQLVRSVAVNTAVSALDISSVAAGSYWLVIEKAGNLLYSQKIIKQ